MRFFDSKALATAFALSFFGAALTSVPTAAQAQAKKAASRAPLASLPESRDLVKALRSIDSRTQSGMTFNDYSREVGDLKVAADALDEVLEARKDDKLRAQLKAAVEPYEQAKYVWGRCIAGECGFDLIALGITEYAVTPYVKTLLETYPQFNAPEDQGGLFMKDERPGGAGRIWKTRILSALWEIGGQRSKPLRLALQ
jgi:hypothetical protein